ncbi:MAG: hypothetical protein GC154_09755 [bacterium]|nr:hypothetical protein [bacterium]
MKWNTKVFVWTVAAVSVLIVSAWAVENQTSDPSSKSTLDFNENDPKDYPLTTQINIDIKGLANFGTVYMLEGIDNETTVISEGGKTSAGATRWARLVFHGVFDKRIRDWRIDVISGKVDKRDIQVDLYNKGGRRVMRYMFRNCWPVRFTLPPLSVDGATRYQERVEFVYDTFDVIDN